MWQEKLKIKKESSLASLYPFSKLIIVALYIVSLSFLSSAKVNGYPIYGIWSLLAVLIMVLLTGKITTKAFFKTFKAIFFLVVFIVIVQIIAVRSEEILYSINVFNLFTINCYKAGAISGLGLGTSITGFAGALAWFFACTENKELISACEQAGMSPKSSYVLLSTLQMITVLQKSSKAIMSAQQARGVETEGNVFVRTKAFVPSLIPLIISSISNTEERVLTLESKGFSVVGERTRLYKVEKNGKEKLAVIIASIITILVILWRLFLWNQ